MAVPFDSPGSDIDLGFDVGHDGGEDVDGYVSGDEDIWRGRFRKMRKDKALIGGDWDE